MEEVLIAGTWWRFDRYEIANGVIQPVKGARLREYEPFDEFLSARSERHEAQPPYQLLTRVVEKLQYDEDGGLTPRSAEQVLNWCSGFGLLGILLHYAQQVRFAPRWGRRRKSPEEDPEALERFRNAIFASEDRLLKKVAARLRAGQPRTERLFLGQTLYRRSSWGSYTFGEEQFLTGPTESKLGKVGSLVPQKHWAVAPPYALIAHPDFGDMIREPLDHTWARFFPSVAPEQRITFEYPQPFSEKFWHLYAEPLSDFLAMARRFRDAFLAAAAMAGNNVADDPAIAPGTSKLNALVSPTGPALLRIDDQSLEQRTVAPTLIGNMALMAQADLAGNRRVIRCHNERCRLLVVAVGYQTRYCSQQCRFAHEKRLQRQREKEAVASASIAGRKSRGGRKGVSK